ncbi:MAG: DUF885 domain-containing protein [Chloroflexi bacterium]|nr:MAG: DUF885 domain-containing protein [Chloroflexota bacterium]
MRHLLASSPVADWEAIEREVIDGYFRFSPNHARVAGDHNFDGVVGDPSGTTIQARIEEIDRQLEKLERLNGLSPDQAADRQGLVVQLKTSRLELTELGRPFNEPMFYTGFDSELDVSSYLKRPYAPIGERLKALRQHLAGYSGYLEAARDNLEPSLPRPNLEIAIEAAAGQADYLDGEVRTAAAGDADTVRAIDQAVVETRAAVEFLKKGLRDAHDHFALGEDRFMRLLQTREMVTMSVGELETMVRADIERNMAAAQTAADAISPGRGVGAALHDLEEHHPTTETIIDDVRATLEGLRRFILEHDLVSIPSETRCLVRPTPSYASYISAAMDSAGPLETVATESYYYVTVPAADWSETSREQWLRHLNYAMLENVSIHEAYPGHFVQSLHERRVGSKTRQLFWSYATVEGFAHYVEEMMLDAGYSTDPKLQLAQRSEALLRDCRFLVALGLHCHAMPMPEAIRLFMSVGFLSELPAQREAMRGAWDPLYLSYTLGKLLILDLRRDLESHAGYALKSFHDAFLGCGYLPVPLIRQLIS